MRIEAPTDSAIREAAQAIRDGKLVVMPTETVYGLAADAMNALAVQKIFDAKGRPSDNPLIVHVASIEQAECIASKTPESARRLMRAFWPGPLTIVLPKGNQVPDRTTAGLDTVALRMPNHEVAIRLILESGTAIAAPSANLFMGLSPTRAENVDPILADQAVMVLDGGPCLIGLESTVVDCCDSPIRILRPGGVSKVEIEALLGEPVEAGQSSERRSPGMYRRHYATRTPIQIVDRLSFDQGGVGFNQPANQLQIALPNDPVAYGFGLYDALFQLDSWHLVTIFVEAPPQTPDWDAVWDRLRKASSEI